MDERIRYLEAEERKVIERFQPTPFRVFRQNVGEFLLGASRGGISFVCAWMGVTMAVLLFRLWRELVLVVFLIFINLAAIATGCNLAFVDHIGSSIALVTCFCGYLCSMVVIGCSRLWLRISLSRVLIILLLLGPLLVFGQAEWFCHASIKFGIPAGDLSGLETVASWYPNIVFYFLPALASFWWARQGQWKVFAINTLAGWTGIGWIAAGLYAVGFFQFTASRVDPLAR